MEPLVGHTMNLCSSLKCAHAFQCGGLQTSHFTQAFKLFCNTSQKNLRLAFCIKFENNMMPHYIEEVHLIK